jgi:hypothetical protein
MARVGERTGGKPRKHEPLISGRKHPFMLHAHDAFQKIVFLIRGVQQSIKKARPAGLFRFVDFE